MMYYFTLSKQSCVTIMYQYTRHGGNSHVVMHLSIDSVTQKHIVSLTGDTVYDGNVARLPQQWCAQSYTRLLFSNKDP